jgi:hypothetical protein
MARRTPQQRIKDVVTSLRVDPGLVDWRDVTVEPWMIAELRAAETAIRRLRREMEQRLDGTLQACAGCGRPLAGRADKRYCSGRCRQAALRARNSDG